MTAPDPVAEERLATDAERAAAPLWQEWALECLDNQQLSHCGHLDEQLIVPTCPYCAEWVAHATHTRERPDPTCDDCSGWIAENRQSAALLDVARRRLPTADIPADVLHQQFEYRGHTVTVVSINGKSDEPWYMLATARTPAGKWLTIRLSDLFPAVPR